MTNKITTALEALQALDLRELKGVRQLIDAEVDQRVVAAAAVPQDYTRAVRECLIDSEAFLKSARDGKLRYEHMGQLDVLLRDMRNLINREDVENYKFKK